MRSLYGIRSEGRAGPTNSYVRFRLPQLVTRLIMKKICSTLRIACLAASVMSAGTACAIELEPIPTEIVTCETEDDKCTDDTAGKLCDEDSVTKRCVVNIYGNCVCRQ